MPSLQEISKALYEADDSAVASANQIKGTFDEQAYFDTLAKAVMPFIEKPKTNEALREKIADIIREYGQRAHKQDEILVAREILSLIDSERNKLTRVVGKQKCKSCRDGYIIHPRAESLSDCDRCTWCDGSGFITRPLTQDEKADIVDMLLEGRAKFINRIDMGLTTYLAHILLPDGSRIERGK